MKINERQALEIAEKVFRDLAFKFIPNTLKVNNNPHDLPEAAFLKVLKQNGLLDEEYLLKQRNEWSIAVQWSLLDTHSAFLALSLEGRPLYLMAKGGHHVFIEVDEYGKAYRVPKQFGTT